MHLAFSSYRKTDKVESLALDCTYYKGKNSVVKGLNEDREFRHQTRRRRYGTYIRGAGPGRGMRSISVTCCAESHLRTVAFSSL